MQYEEQRGLTVDLDEAVIVLVNKLEAYDVKLMGKAEVIRQQKEEIAAQKANVEERNVRLQEEQARKAALKEQIRQLEQEAYKDKKRIEHGKEVEKELQDSIAQVAQLDKKMEGRAKEIEGLQLQLTNADQLIRNMQGSKLDKAVPAMSVMNVDAAT